MTVNIDMKNNNSALRVHIDDLTMRSRVSERHKRLFVLMCLLVGAFFIFFTTRFSINADVTFAQNVRHLYNLQHDMLGHNSHTMDSSSSDDNVTRGGKDDQFFQNYKQVMARRRLTLENACK